MTYRTILLAGALLLIGCSSSDPAAAPTTVAPETTASTSTTVAETTTTKKRDTLSREAEVAIRRCLDEADISLPLMLNLDGVTAADKAKDACGEAATQLKVDATGPGPVGQLGVQVAALNVIIAQGALDVAVNGQLDDAAFQKMLDDISATAALIEGLLAEL